MVRSKEELLEAVRTLAGESVTSDEVISLIEDISDTIADRTDETDWKAEAERIDREWREKYTSRFFSGADPEDPEPDSDDEADEIREYKFEELFEEKEEEE